MCMKELMLKRIDLSSGKKVPTAGREGIRQEVAEVLFSRKAHLSAWVLVCLSKSVGEE